MMEWAWNSLPAICFVTLLPLASLFDWYQRWMMSGAPVLSFFILLGDSNRRRVLPFVTAWTLLATLNLIYSIVSTSWLLYWGFVALAYPSVLLICVFQFRWAASLTRQALRGLIKQVHFIDDKVAFFEIPALEIDTQVAGFMVIRGVTFSLSSLTLTVHGVEVVVKLSPDLELAIQTENVEIALFRTIVVGDCYANVKGGSPRESSERAHDQHASADRPWLTGFSSANSLTDSELRNAVANGNIPRDSSAEAAFKNIQQVSSQNDPAGLKYQQALRFIQDTSAIRQSRQYVEQVTEEKEKKETKEKAQLDDTRTEKALRAAICSQLHAKPSVTNPPERSIKVTTLQNLAPPLVRNFLHRIPLLLRLLLNVLSYFHIVTILSITAAASGRWIESMLVNGIFKGYGDVDAQLQQFKESISAWVSGANFAVQLGQLEGLSQVPISSSNDIRCRLSVQEISVYRTLPKETEQTRVASLRGADATFSLPSFLLPHHEHLIPEAPASGTPEGNLYQEDFVSEEPRKPDETSVRTSIHASLPAVFHQELLDFVAILVKASKLVEVEHESRSSSYGDEENDGNDRRRFSDIKEAVNHKLKLGMTKAVVASDQWLARQVGKIMKKLEQVSGDVGYKGDIPVPLAPYRQTGWRLEGDKLLP